MLITSAVEMMKVTVEIRTMESENRARNWARLEVQGYLVKVSKIGQRYKPSLTNFKILFTQLYSTASSATCPTLCCRNPPQLPEMNIIFHNF